MLDNYTVYWADQNLGSPQTDPRGPNGFALRISNEFAIRAFHLPLKPDFLKYLKEEAQSQVNDFTAELGYDEIEIQKTPFYCFLQHKGVNTGLLDSCGIIEDNTPLRLEANDRTKLLEGDFTYKFVQYWTSNVSDENQSRLLFQLWKLWFDLTKSSIRSNQ